MDMASSIPLYQQIYDDLRAAIKDGIYERGDKIPSELELSEKYDVSRITVRHAIENLCLDGYLTKMQGRGTFVGSHQLSSRLLRCTGASSFSQMCAQIDAVPGAHLVERQIVPVRKDERAFFGLEEDALMLAIRRVRTADDLPIADERVLLPYSDAGTLFSESLENVSIFDAIEHLQGRRPSSCSKWRVNAVCATTEQAALLGISAGDPMFYSETYYLDEDEQPVVIGRDYFIGGRYELSLA